MLEVPVSIGRNGAAGHGSSLSYREAMEPPCLSCQSSPCCTHLMLTDFQMKTLMDVDYARFLLNFEGIVLGLDESWKVDVYLYQPCGFLDVGSGLCTVHSTPLQPNVCVHYNGHTCGYRVRMDVDNHELDEIRPVLNTARMEWLAAQLAFDDRRRISSTPAWAEVLEGFRNIPISRRPLPVAAPDPVYDEWQSIALSGKPSERESTVHRYGDAEVLSPCEGCGAWCCKMLVFNRGLPREASQLDFLRYSAGFPSVEIGVAEDGWAVIVHTTCRHLDGNRCSVFGQPERPLKCGYYDALSCGYRGHFGIPQPSDIVRVKRPHFEAVAASLAFDELGRIVAIPPLDLIRRQVEDAMRSSAATTK
jgi:hypothetical protein